MPIRMEDDPQDQQEQWNDAGGGGGRPNFPGGGGGGGGNILGLLPLLLSLFKGKGIILLLIIAGVGYFLFSRDGCSSGGGGILNDISKLATGGFLDPRQFEKASIYEPLADDNSRNPLPESANLQRYAPAVGNQGQQGSCVAWSSAYGARSILEGTRTGQNTTKFSPSFLYNQIGLQGCEGSYIIRAMEYMTQQGSVPYERFPYDDANCSRQPDNSLVSEAAQYKMRGFNRLSAGDRNDAIDIRAIKENLSQGAPVVIGMMVGQSFMHGMVGKDLWVPEADDKSMMGFGGHAMCVVGYDDKKYGGSFLLMNSWGPEWGTNGFAWVRYPEFNYFVREAYGLEPMQKLGTAANAPLQCEIGLVQVNFDGKKTVPTGYIQLRKSQSNRFETTAPVRVGTKFKVEIKNSTECYIYIFGKETDGSGYVLFPYPRKDDPRLTKYSPFCGITGYRLFPKDKSMTPDSIGTRDMIAFMVSRDSLDWNAINTSINTQPRNLDYTARVQGAIGQRLATDAQYSVSGKGNVQFTSSPAPGKVVFGFIEIDKR